MKKREKITLAVLLDMNKKITKIELAKLMFLLKHETSFASDDSFYDFIPYHYGPYSFSLFSDVNNLARQGFLSVTDTEISYNDKNRIQREISSIQFPETSDIWNIIKKYGGLSQSSLVNYVYKQYPWFASRSKISRVNHEMQVAPIAIYTIGYEKKSIDTFLHRLLSIGIKRIIDVRNNPISRVYGFSKKNLENLLSKVMISYSHFPNLGIPSEFRQNLATENDYILLFKKYNDKILSINEESISRVIELLKSEPSALLCFEDDPSHCHRGLLAKKISSISNILIKHI